MTYITKEPFPVRSSVPTGNDSACDVGLVGNGVWLDNSQVAKDPSHISHSSKREKRFQSNVTWKKGS